MHTPEDLAAYQKAFRAVDGDPAQLLVVASAANPSHSSSLAVPGSHGLGISSGPGPWCNWRNRSALSRWLVMPSI